MVFFTTENERKSFLITSSLFVVLLLVIFLYKFQPKQYPENMLQGGEMAIRFGDSQVGQGPVVPSDLPAPSQEEAKVQSSKAEAAERNIVTQNTKKAPVVNASDVKKTENNATTGNQNRTSQVNRVNNTTADLVNRLNSSTGTSPSSSGNTTTPGNQGALTGDAYSISLFGGSGSGTGVGDGVGWGLNGRTLVSHTIHKPSCPNEVGTVVVEVTVNPSGNVINAKRSLNGTTTTEKCLVDAAVATAKTFKWRADNKAPNSQIGFVVITFKSN